MSGDYQFIANIGQGMYGQVYKAINKKENKYYAIKRLNFKDINEKEKKQINNEVSLIKNLKHPNVISYKDSFNDVDNYFNIVTTFCEGGDIYNKIQKQNGEYFKEDQILNWMVQILLGLNYIHKNGIIHRDIKPQNIFIQNSHIICIGDFGIAKIINQIQTQTMTSIIGTPLYMSPESFNEPNSKNLASDIWSMGCCLYEICNLKHAFGADRLESVFCKVREGKHPPVNKKYSSELRNIIESMLSVKPSDRPTIPHLLKNNNFLRPKIANYISDFKKNYKLYDGNEEQVSILEGQAEEFGIFKNKINTQVRGNSLEKDKRIKKNNYKVNNIRRDSSNPISPEKEEKPKKYSLDKNKRNKMYDYDITNKNKKIRNKNIEYNFSGNNKHSKHGDYTSDDNKKRHNNKDKDNISPMYNNHNNNVQRIKSNFSNNKKRTSGRPQSFKRAGKFQNGLEHNISLINKKEKNNGVEENYYNYNDNNKKKFNKIENNVQKNNNDSNDNIQFQNKIGLNDANEMENNNNLNNTKERLLNERINYFKSKCLNNLEEEQYKKAYN